MSHKHSFRTCLLTLSLLLLTLSSLLGQGRHGRHPFDFKKFNLGFLMGLTYNTYNLKEQVNVVDDGVLLERVQLYNQPGINLGMITNLILSDHVSFRFIPTVALEQRTFDYTFAGDSVVERKIEASYFNMPFLFQFKTKYYDKYRIYTLAGAQVGLNLASAKKVRDDPNLLKIQSQDVALVLGFGITLYGDRLRLSPEIRYSFGITNIYVPEFTSHANAISHLYSQVLTLNFNFE